MCSDYQPKLWGKSHTSINESQVAEQGPKASYLDVTVIELESLTAPDVDEELNDVL